MTSLPGSTPTDGADTWTDVPLFDATPYEVEPPTVTRLGFEPWATLSDDGRYRYALGRRWDRGPAATFVMLNPSTADATQDDPTIRRCIGFAKAWGLAGITVVNLYALRSTNPAGLWDVDDPIGPDNDAHLHAAATIAEAHDAPLVAAWGANARPDRLAEVLALPGFHRLTALGVTKAGQPRHPLYLPATATLSRWEVPA